ncbi:hypothetical protein MRX96_026725 [Rhipicephalus microplus]
MEEFAAPTLEQLPASEPMIEIIKLSIQVDTTLSSLATLCTSAWPFVHGLAPKLKRYAEGANELSLAEGSFSKGYRLLHSTLSWTGIARKTSRKSHGPNPVFS